LISKCSVLLHVSGHLAQFLLAYVIGSLVTSTQQTSTSTGT